MDEQLEFTHVIAARLESEDIPYMVTGSMALTYYGHPRMTRDVDLIIDCGVEDSPTIVKLFEGDCYVDGDSVRDAVENRAMFNIIHHEWVIKADFIVRKEDEYRVVEFGLLDLGALVETCLGDFRRKPHGDSI